MTATPPPDTASSLLNLSGTDDHADVTRQRNRFTEEALARHKRQGMELAVRGRLAALVVIAILLPFVNPRFEVLYYEALLVMFAIIGLLQRRIGRVGTSRAELFLMFCDLVLLTATLIVPNPFAEVDWPVAVQYRFGNFIYFYVFLAGATLAYTWRTVVAMGTWTTVIWSVTAVLVWRFSERNEALSETVFAAFADMPRLAELLDPNDLQAGLRIQEVVVFLIVAAILAVAGRRSNTLLLAQAAVERERANLARYFSPNVVERLSNNDDPLKQVTTQEIAVLFVDIVGFTAYAANRSPHEVIGTLREFHGMMEGEVFRYNGTLDKYLGDGLMATFGTPFVGEEDALDALHCARAMAQALDEWNATRRAAGLPEIRAGFGVHAGPAVLGDIGANRLEFAVIGTTVNISSRLEALTRPLGVRLVASDALIERARAQAAGDDRPFVGLTALDDQSIRGVDQALRVWTLA